jgi:AraC-like DNA-binding protein
VEPRRRFRNIVTGLSGMCIVIVVITEILLRGEEPVPVLEIVNTAAILVLAFGFTLYSLNVRAGLFARDTPARAPARDVPPPDDPLLHALNQAMLEDQIYHREGLGIADLARHLGSQEYILRRLINAQLGYRNFNEFLNRHRVEEACTRLADPTQTRLRRSSPSPWSSATARSGPLTGHSKSKPA